MEDSKSPATGMAHKHPVGMEDVVLVHITDIANRLPGKTDEIDELAGVRVADLGNGDLP